MSRRPSSLCWTAPRRSSGRAHPTLKQPALDIRPRCVRARAFAPTPPMRTATTSRRRSTGTPGTSGTRTSTRQHPLKPRTARRSAMTTPVRRAMAGRIWTPTEAGTTCPAQGRCGSRRWRWTTRDSIPTGTAHGWRIRGRDISGLLLIRGAGLLIAVAAGRTLAASVGVGRRARVAEALAGASRVAASSSISGMLHPAIGRFAFRLLIPAAVAGCAPFCRFTTRIACSVRRALRLSARACA